jgi:hypothetical protein
LAAICGLSNGLLTARLFVAQLLVAGRPHAERKCDLKLSYRLGIHFNQKLKYIKTYKNRHKYSA